MIGISKFSAACTGLLALCAALATAPAFADGDCRQWDVPPTLIVKQWDGPDVAFQLQQDGTRFHGWAFYQTTKGWVKGNVSGGIVNNAFSARVLWTYSGVNAIGRYQGKIEPRSGVPAGETTYGFVFRGSAYDEYDSSSFDYWNANHFICHVDVPPPEPERKLDIRVPDVQYADEKKRRAALAEEAIRAQVPITRPDSVRLQDRIRVPDTTPRPPRPICDLAREARARNSPAAPGLEAKCLASGGSL